MWMSPFVLTASCLSPFIALKFTSSFGRFFEISSFFQALYPKVPFTYSIGTAITAFSLVMTGWFTGFLQEYVGYRLFFLLVAMLGVISFIVTYFLPVTKEIGKRKRMV